MPLAPSPVTCPYCGTPLPLAIAGQSWHVRERARAIRARHLTPGPRRCTPLTSVVVTG